jgi:hypothetical protein
MTSNIIDFPQPPGPADFTHLSEKANAALENCFKALGKLDKDEDVHAVLDALVAFFSQTRPNGDEDEEPA